MIGRWPYAAAGHHVVALPDRRRWWLKALDLAIAAGELIAEGGELSRDEAFDMVGVVVQAGEVPFPLPFASAKAAAAGFYELGRGLNAAAEPELKAALGLAWAAAARCCRRILEIHVEEQVAVTRRRLGED